MDVIDDLAELWDTIKLHVLAVSSGLFCGFLALTIFALWSTARYGGLAGVQQHIDSITLDGTLIFVIAFGLVFLLFEAPALARWLTEKLGFDSY